MGSDRFCGKKKIGNILIIFIKSNKGEPRVRRHVAWDQNNDAERRWVAEFVDEREGLDTISFGDLIRPPKSWCRRWLTRGCGAHSGGFRGGVRTWRRLVAIWLLFALSTCPCDFFNGELKDKSVHVKLAEHHFLLI